jgi:hypothetical protein
MVGHQILDLSIMVRVHARQPVWKTLHFRKEDEGFFVCGVYSYVIQNVVRG